MLYGDEAGDTMIDHINGDPWDNRRSNLRITDNASNQWNRKAPVNNTSKIKGVTWSKQLSMWKSTIRANGKYFHLGYYNTRGLAGSAVAKGSLAIHGKFSPYYRDFARC